MRTLGAFLVAPFPVALFQAVIVGLWPKEGMGVFENPLSMFVALCLYFYIFGLLIGVPAWILLRGRGAISLPLLMKVGLLAGLIPVGSALAVSAIRGQLSAYALVYNLLLFGLGGLAAGAVFWFVAFGGRRRRD